MRTIAGNGTAAFGGENVVANSSPINGCLGVATNGNGRVYFSENHRIRVVDVEGVLYTYAGEGASGYAGDGGPAILARLFQPMGLWVDAGDNLFVTDSGNHSIRVVYGADGKIATYAGHGVLGFAGDGGPATQADMAYPNAMTGDSAGNVYIADSNNNRIREVFKVSGVINTIAGSGEETIAGDGYPATSATLSVPYVAAVLPNGGTLISDTYNSRLRIVDVYGGISTFAGTTYGFGGDNGPAFSAQMKAPVGTAVGPDGSIYVADVEDHRIRKIDPDGTITTFAGTGVAGSNGDNGLAKDAQLNSPAGLAFDAEGSLYVSEADGDRIRVISPSGYIFTVAGTEIAGFNGDGIPPTSAQVSNPAGIFYDNINNALYVADADNGRVRKIDFGLNVITTVAGNPNGIDADNIPATSAMLVWPSMISFDAAGRMYITDMDGNKVRVVTPVVGAPSMISTIAGTGLPGVIGDGGPASSALLNTPTAAVIDRQGNLLIADSANDRIRKVILTSAETTPPLLDVFQNPVPTGNEWYNVPLQFTLYASDAGSGVKEVYYELTGAQTETNHIPGSIGTFVISTAGLTNIHAYAVDNDNNVSVGYQKMVGLDFTAPRPPTVDVNPLPDANGWNYTPVTVTFTPAGDPGSPASGVSSCTSPVSVTQETTGIVVSGTCHDAAGNVSSATSVTVKINLSGLQADLALLAESEPEVVNGKVRYGVTITNNGPSDAHNVQVTDLLTRFTATNVGAGSGTCSNLGSSVTCTWPTMPNNGSDYVWIEVTPPNSGWAMHEFVSSATEADPNRNNSTAFVNGEIVNNTRTGTNIAVVADATSSTSVVFDNVTRAGLTTIKAVPGQAPPAGYRQGSAPLIFDAGTTAGFTGLVTVTLDLRGVVFRHPATVRLFKWEAGVWYDITAGLNLSAGVVSGRTGSLTRFGVFEMNDRAPEAAAVDRVIPSQSSTGMAVTLDGTHSADADGDTLTYKWTGAFPEGNGTVTGPTPTVTLPMGASAITLIVNDGELDSASMATTVTVSSFKITAPLASASVQKGQAAPFEIQVSPQ